MSTSMEAGTSAGRVRTRTVSRRRSSVPPAFSTATDSPTYATGTSMIISSVIFTR